MKHHLQFQVSSFVRNVKEKELILKKRKTKNKQSLNQVYTASDKKF